MTDFNTRTIESLVAEINEDKDVYLLARWALDGADESGYAVDDAAIDAHMDCVMSHGVDDSLRNDALEIAKAINKQR